MIVLLTDFQTASSQIEHTNEALHNLVVSRLHGGYDVLGFLFIGCSHTELRLHDSRQCRCLGTLAHSVSCKEVQLLVANHRFAEATSLHFARYHRSKCLHILTARQGCGQQGLLDAACYLLLQGCALLGSRISLHLIVGLLQLAVCHHQLMTYVAAVHDIADEYEEDQGKENIPGKTVPALELCLLLRQSLYVCHDGGLLLFVELPHLFEGRLQQVADSLAHSHRRVLPTCNEVCLILLQQEVLDIVHHRFRRAFSHQRVQTAVVVGSLVPSLGSHQVFVGCDTSLWCLAVFSGQEGIEGLGSLLFLFQSLVGQSLIDIKARHLLVGIDDTMIRALLIILEQLAKALNPLQGLLIFLDGQTGIRDIDQSGDGVLIRCI